MNREAIYTALFKQLQKMECVETFSRILEHWDDVAPNRQPALFMTHVSERAERVTGLPAKYIIDAKVWIYTHRDSNGDVPSAQINNILDELDRVIAPDPSPLYKNTLGGLVEKCYVDGEIVTDEGTLGLQAVAVVPIRMLLTTS